MIKHVTLKDFNMQHYIRFGVYKMVRDFVVPLCRQQGCRVDAHTMTLEESLAESRRKVLEEAGVGNCFMGSVTLTSS
jgi:hypothetical protein